MDPLNSIHEQASKLVANLASGITSEWCPSSMSTNVYDTAWVSMVATTDQGERRWLFPEAFRFILDSQHDSGHWGDDGPETNSILCTMAALLACLEHYKHVIDRGCPISPHEITVRISKAIIWLENFLRRWEGEGIVDSVALEILIPAHQRLLADNGISFTSPLLERMKNMSERRLSKLRLDALYAGKQMTVLHSLEALIGRIDFNKLRHSKIRGSMLGSPSSTAAYLIHAQSWDKDAELYLKNVFLHGQGKGNGSFPSAAPIDLFEISWVLSTLLEGGIPAGTLGQENTSVLVSHLVQRLTDFGEIVGFSAGMLPDADDTAKCLHTLALFEDYGKDAGSMISRFWSPSSFKTYERESTRSISANCNVLKALLATRTPERFAPQILTAASFICDSWMIGTPHDKWNTAWEYCAMLSAQGLVRLLTLAESESFNFLPFELKMMKIPIALSRIACQTIHSQAADGSFGDGSDEITAYATLSLVALASPVTGLSFICEEMSIAIKAASGFLQARLGQWKPRPIWVEKVTYSSDMLMRAYCLAALNQAMRYERQTPTETLNGNLQAIKLCNLFRSVPLFTQAEGRKNMLRLALQESQPFLSRLEHIRFDIFPKPPKVNEKYLRIIPFAWTASNYLSGSPLPATVLMDMMEISMLNYQVDEYIEMMVPQFQAQEVSIVRKKLDDYIEERLEDTSELDVGAAKRHCGMNGNGTSNESIQPMLDTLCKYVDRVLNCPHVHEASRACRQQVRQDVIGYLQAQIASIGAKSRLGQPGPYSSFFNWVHTLGARNTSLPFSFAYFLCLINYAFDAPTPMSSTSRPISEREQHSISFEADYLLKDLCGSLSRVYRMYNDYGSIYRDREEGNLNSVDFFFKDQGEATNGHQRLVEDDAKRAIWSLAVLEREHMALSFGRLRNCLTPKLHDMVQVFVNVTDLFGQIYVAQDIGTRTKMY